MQDVDPVCELGEAVVERFDSAIDHDDYSQPRALYELLSADERERLVKRIGSGLGQAREEVQRRTIGHFNLVHPEYGAGVARSLGLEVELAR